MGSLIEELKRRAEAARAEADRLRARIGELSGGLARAEEQASGDFGGYWRFHLEREHQRLYPATKQGQYALGA